MNRDSVLEELQYFNLTYRRARDDSGSIKRGDIFIGEKNIPHYPQIGRIFTIFTGIPRNFDEKERFWVEEKYDGYNVRVFMHEGDIFAATRGGIICPFSVEKLYPYFDNLKRFFDTYREYILVGEIVGEKNPYMDAPTTYPITRETEIFFFDIMDKKGNLFLPEKRRVLLEEFSLPQVPLLGVFKPDEDGLRKIMDIVKELNSKKREGIVLKSGSVQGKYLKYVTPVINLMDIAGDSLLMAELPGNFFTSRLIRYVISSLELNVEEKGFNLENLFYNGIKEAVRRFYEEGYVFKDISIFFFKEKNLKEFLRIFWRVSKHIRLENVETIKYPEGYILKFRKVYLDSTRKLRDYLGGKYIYD